MGRHDEYDHLMGRHDAYDRLEAGGMYDLSMDRLLSTWFVQMNMGTGMGTCTGMDMDLWLVGNMLVDNMFVGKIHRRRYRRSCSSHCSCTGVCASQEHQHRTISCTSQDNTHFRHN